MSETESAESTEEMAQEEASAEESIGRRIARWAKEIAIFGVLLVGVFWFQTRSLVPSGEPAPTWELATLDGGSLSSESLKGRPTVLFFWAPWCGVCKADAHNIASVQEAVGDDVNIVSVALSFESIRNVRSFAEEHGVPGPVVLGDRAMAKDFRIDSFPTLYILDSDGRVASRAVGYTTEVGIRGRLMLTN